MPNAKLFFEDNYVPCFFRSFYLEILISRLTSLSFFKIDFP